MAPRDSIRPPRSWRPDAGTAPSGLEEEPAEDWVISYIDMVTLLLTFFILLVALGAIERKRNPDKPALHDRAAVAEVALQAVAAPVPPPPPAPPFPRLDGDRPAEPAGPSPAELIHALLQAASLDHDVEVVERPGRLLVRLGERILFGTGETELSLDGQALIDRLAPALTATEGEISVEGYTDDRPISTGRFTSNWDLAAARAVTVLRQLQSRGVPAARLRAIGYGAMRPVADNATPEGRARNRRVELLVERMDEP